MHALILPGNNFLHLGNAFIKLYKNSTFRGRLFTIFTGGGVGVDPCDNLIQCCANFFVPRHILRVSHDQNHVQHPVHDIFKFSFLSKNFFSIKVL